MENNLTPKTKWWEGWWVKSGVVLSTLFSGWVMLQNAEIRRENAEIKHGQDVKYAVVITGMRVTASKLEMGYQTLRKREAQYISINRQQPCAALPSSLAVAEPPIEYVPPEAIFMQMGQENHEN